MLHIIFFTSVKLFVIFQNPQALRFCSSARANTTHIFFRKHKNLARARLIPLSITLMLCHDISAVPSWLGPLWWRTGSYSSSESTCHATVCPSSLLGQRLQRTEHTYWLSEGFLNFYFFDLRKLFSYGLSHAYSLIMFTLMKHQL